MNTHDILCHSVWHPASGHRAGWRVVRECGHLEEHLSRSGRRIFFKTYKAALRRAFVLNYEKGEA